ncbi:MAG: hypothetical protein LBH07_08690 [Treponema sp.]|nr:hypothetical protein [Treponema sp.]
MIPERINNKPVTAIGNNAFREKQLTAVTIVDASGKIVTPPKELPGVVLSSNDVLRYNPTTGTVYWAIKDPGNAGRIAVYSYKP